MHTVFENITFGISSSRPQKKEICIYYFFLIEENNYRDIVSYDTAVRCRIIIISMIIEQMTAAIYVYH